MKNAAEDEIDRLAQGLPKNRSAQMPELLYYPPVFQRLAEEGFDERP